MATFDMGEGRVITVNPHPINPLDYEKRLRVLSDIMINPHLRETHRLKSFYRLAMSALRRGEAKAYEDANQIWIVHIIEGEEEFYHAV